MASWYQSSGYRRAAARRWRGSGLSQERAAGGNRRDRFDVPAGFVWPGPSAPAISPLAPGVQGLPFSPGMPSGASPFTPQPWSNVPPWAGGGGAGGAAWMRWAGFGRFLPWIGLLLAGGLLAYEIYRWLQTKPPGHQSTECNWEDARYSFHCFLSIKSPGCFTNQAAVPCGINCNDTHVLELWKRTTITGSFRYNVRRIFGIHSFATGAGCFTVPDGQEHLAPSPVIPAEVPSPTIYPPGSPIGQPMPSPMAPPIEWVPDIPDSPWRETGNEPPVVTQPFWPAPAPDPVLPPTVWWPIPVPSPGAPTIPGPATPPKTGVGAPQPSPQPQPQPEPSPGPKPGNPPVGAPTAPGGPSTGGPRIPPRASSRPNVRARPRERTKESKRRLNSAGWRLLNLMVGGPTEAGDLVDSFWWALPARYRTPPVWVGDHWEKPPMQDQVADLYRHWDQVDFDKAMQNVVANQIEDFVIGKAGKLVGQANVNAANWSGLDVSRGWGTGPAF